MNIPHWPWYETWIPFIARLVFGSAFLFSAFGKIPGTQMFGFEAGMTAAAGVPFAPVFVALAFVLEVVCALALIVGWHARRAALVLAVFSIALGLVFYRDWSSQVNLGYFISCLELAAGLLYVSVYGAKSIAIAKD
jgi:putative oxidoreductase